MITFDPVYHAYIQLNKAVGSWLLAIGYWPLTLRVEPAHVDFIDLERDSAIRVRALMALAAYSVQQ